MKCIIDYVIILGRLRANYQIRRRVQQTNSEQHPGISQTKQQETQQGNVFKDISESITDDRPLQPPAVLVGSTTIPSTTARVRVVSQPTISTSASTAHPSRTLRALSGLLCLTLSRRHTRLLPTHRTSSARHRPLTSVPMPLQPLQLIRLGRLARHNLLNNIIPRLCILLSPRTELILLGPSQLHLAAEVLALDAEAVAIEPAHRAVRQVQRHLRAGVLVHIVVRLELVQELRRRDDVQAARELLEQAGLALQAALAHGLCAAMVLVGEGGGAQGARRGGGVDQDVVVAVDEALPFEAGVDTLGDLDHVAI